MKLNSFSITNFRSITIAHKIPLGDISTIIGKNNEGKSNVLRGLNLAMETLAKKNFARSYIRATRYERANYSWERDFPISKQALKGTKDTVFRLEFSLSPEEIAEFYKKIENYINGTLTIEIRFGKDNKAQIKPIKSGKGTKTGFGNKIERIKEYIIEHLDFVYIPAIRTEDEAFEVIREMVGSELSKIEEDPIYQYAISQISDLQRPILDELGEKIRNSLIGFLPSVVGIEVKNLGIQLRRSFASDFEMLIDDGNKTPLEQKGDGVKSLVALTLLKEKRKAASFLLIAIEEPESHIHPGAMHILRKAIYDLSESNQVIVATHNPIFVNREDVSSNIIIENGNARPAKKLMDLRNALGVLASDNLQSADYAIVVEGLTDQVVLESILKYLSPHIKKFLENRLLIVYPLTGASKLDVRLQSLRNGICKPYVILDSDKAGKQACIQAQKSDLLSRKDYTLLKSPVHANESELEDLIPLSIYKDAILEEYGVDLDHASFSRKDIKWSDRLTKTFEIKGKTITDEDLNDIKKIVSEAAKENPDKIMTYDNQELFNEIRGNIEQLIEQ